VSNYFFKWGNGVETEDDSEGLRSPIFFNPVIPGRSLQKDSERDPVYFKSAIPTRVESVRPYKALARITSIKRPQHSRRSESRSRLVFQAFVVLLLLIPIGLLASSSAKSFAKQVAIAAVNNVTGSKDKPSANTGKNEAQSPTVIQGIRRFDGGSFSRLVIELSNTPNFKALSSSNTLALKFESAGLGSSFQQTQAETTGLVKQVIATETGGAVDMRLQFRPGTSFAAFTLGSPSRLVIDVRDDESTDSELQADLGRMYTPLTNNGVVKRIVIDAGHGGRDLGALSPDGFAEKEVTLEVARLLKHDIETRLGIEVVLTRDGDYYVPLPLRSQKANESGADLFISLHANAAEASENETGDESGLERTGGVDAHGVETYFLSRATSSAAEQIAARENAAGGVTGPLEQNNGAKIIESHLLASYIQRCLVRGLRSVTPSAARDRGVKQAPFFVLNNTQIPSVLVEVSFITSREDQQRLRTTAFRQKIADSLLEGVRSYILNVSQRKPSGEDQIVIR